MENQRVKQVQLNCGQGRTQVSLSIIPVAYGAAGDGIFVFNGEGKLLKRNFKKEVDIINIGATKSLLARQTPKSFAVPVDAECHLPVTIYVGIKALKVLCSEINCGKYEYFRHNLLQ